MNEKTKQTDAPDSVIQPLTVDSRFAHPELEGLSQFMQEEPATSQVPTLGKGKGKGKNKKSKLKKVDLEVALQSKESAIALPFLGMKSAEKHQRILSWVLMGSLLVLALSIFMSLRQANEESQQVAAAGRALMQSQRLAKSVGQALIGNTNAFKDVKDSSHVLTQSIRDLHQGGEDFGQVNLALTKEVEDILSTVDTVEKHSRTILGQEKILVEVGTILKSINQQSVNLLLTAESITNLKLQRGESASEVSVAGQLAMLTQRIGKSANEFITIEGVSPDAVFMLGKDLNMFRELTDALLSGNPVFKVTATKDPEIREQIESLSKQFERIKIESSVILDNLSLLVEAREAQQFIVSESEPLREKLQKLQNDLTSYNEINVIWWSLLALSAILALGSAGMIAWVQLQDSRQRQRIAEQERQYAQLQQEESKQLNERNQQAIMRLMDEIQQVAEGDLTKEATVNEDITGAIADTVNYTVEELRRLVTSVQSTSDKVAETTSSVVSTSSQLLQASNAQLTEIRQTGQAVLSMAERINTVADQAQQSSNVAQQSLQAASSGLGAVRHAIGGMNAIRDHIQDTAKRIKRLGESSQEIGEITELISEITEQTNVLALNAAIQAASAGEAGRGFSVVAEEVQRLAERSADATRQIAALVKTIQTDTHAAVAAMERSTAGVVEGARLSDNAGTALTEIDQVTRRLAQLVDRISKDSLKEAESANSVAKNIQNIFEVTEKTGQGTESTATQVKQLAEMAEQLRESVARFRI